MVGFVAFLQTTQNRNRTCNVRLVNHNGLETTLKSLVLLKILLVLVEGCGTDSTKFAAGKCRFQNVCSIHCALRFSSSDKGVDFINEKHDFSVAFNNFLNYCFQPFLEFSLILCSCDKKTHIKRVDFLGFQVVGDIALDDTPCKTFGDCRLTDTRFTY